MHVPAWRRFVRFNLAPIKSIAINPGSNAAAALDPEVIACELAAFCGAPPLHRDAFGPFDMCDLMQHAPPTEAHRRSVRHFGDRLDRFGTFEQPDRSRGCEA